MSNIYINNNDPINNSLNYFYKTIDNYKPTEEQQHYLNINQSVNNPSVGSSIELDKIVCDNQTVFGIVDNNIIRLGTTVGNSIKINNNCYNNITNNINITVQTVNKSTDDTKPTYLVDCCESYISCNCFPITENIYNCYKDCHFTCANFFTCRKGYYVNVNSGKTDNEIVVYNKCCITDSYLDTSCVSEILESDYITTDLSWNPKQIYFKRDYITCFFGKVDNKCLSRLNNIINKPYQEGNSYGVFTDCETFSKTVNDDWATISCICAVMKDDDEKIPTAVKMENREITSSNISIKTWKPERAKKVLISQILLK